MNVGKRKVPEGVDSSVSDRVNSDILAALKSITTQGQKFIINDKLWYWRNPRGKIRPTVVNSAAFITSRFKEVLQNERGWEVEVEIAGQTIDSYVEIDCPRGMLLEKTKVGRLAELCEEHFEERGPDLAYVEIYRKYVRRSCFNAEGLPEELTGLLQQADGDATLRIGLEFETGNIASSFRAIKKLGGLFQRGHIDAAVFITSLDKGSTAARIWPISNRNGSFEELENRDYLSETTVPLWEFSFSPDNISKSAPYLGTDGNTYTPISLDEQIEAGGSIYEAFAGYGGDRILKPVTEPEDD